MEKLDAKGLEIRLQSVKNNSVVIVHSQEARLFFKLLEDDDSILSYETNVPLADWQRKISSAGLRKVYMELEWTTDFVLSFADGHTGVRELVTKEQLTKRAVIERLEISRRYWKQASVLDWKVVVAVPENEL